MTAFGYNCIYICSTKKIHLSTSSLATSFDNDKPSLLDPILIFAADQTPQNPGPGWNANSKLVAIIMHIPSKMKNVHWSFIRLPS